MFLLNLVSRSCLGDICDLHQQPQLLLDRTTGFKVRPTAHDGLYMLSHLIRELILPPGSLILLLVIAAGLLNRRPDWSRRIVLFVIATLYLLSIPLTSKRLTSSLQSVPALEMGTLVEFKPDLIVVPGAGVRYDAPEFGGLTVPASGSTQRLYYAAYLARKSKLPILVSGGYGDKPTQSEAHAMATTLRDWGFQEIIEESASKNTMENAVFSFDLVHSEGYKKILLVTSANHAERAEWAFRKAGFQVLSAPTGFRSDGPWEKGILNLVPTHGHFNESAAALRAHLSGLWYKLRY